MKDIIQSKKDLQIGFKAPNFKLQDVVTGNFFNLNDLKGSKGIVIMFLNNHCPYAKHVNEEIVRVANDYRVIGFGFVAISSSDIAVYPEDSPQQMMEVAREEDYSFDKDLSVAKAYHVKETPDFLVFDKAMEMTYHGQLDDSRPQNNIPLSGTSLRRALDAILSNRPPIENQKPSNANEI
ncbi:MAG: thioredoxin family protein [Psychroflexus halocasei]